MSMYQRSFRRRCVSISHLVPVCSLEPPVSSWDIAPNCTFLTGQVEAGFHGMSEFDSGGPDTASRRNEEAGAQGEGRFFIHSGHLRLHTWVTWDYMAIRVNLDKGAVPDNTSPVFNTGDFFLLNCSSLRIYCHSGW